MVEQGTQGDMASKNEAVGAKRESDADIDPRQTRPDGNPDPATGSDTSDGAGESGAGYGNHGGTGEA